VRQDRQDIEVIERRSQDTSLPMRASPGAMSPHSIPSFGPTVAATLIACLAELGPAAENRSHCWPALRRLPIIRQARGSACRWGGRPALRRALHLAALSAAAHNPGMKVFING